MEELDQIICKINDLQNIEDTLNEYDALKAEVNTIYEQKGEDGFTVEFFKYFFNVIGSNLVDSFNHAHEKGQLSILKKGGFYAYSQSRFRFTGPPKLEANSITLLNTDYKIAAKAVARRIEKMLPKIINSDQTGFINGRYIGENIRLICDIVDYTETENLPGILLSLDLKKAFDTLEWPYFNKVLDSLNCEESVKRWISVFMQILKQQF